MERRKGFVMWSLLIAAILLCIVGFVQFSVLRIRVTLADEQIAVFEEMTTAARGTTDPQEVSGKLRYLLDYYPSGTTQVKGTHLDRIVETARSHAIAAMIGHLRSTTGRDLGEDPRQWLSEYLDTPKDITGQRREQ